ncbi:MAG: hypothetical protein K8R99_00685 [Actinomycetia bacterium]|nr:hypothetical protein [Actinomycetes bacterium]
MSGEQEINRVTVSLRAIDRRRVEEIAEKEQVNKNDAIRLALATEQFVSRVLGDGGTILVKNKDGSVREVEFVR